MIIVGIYSPKDIVRMDEVGEKYFVVHDHNLSILKDGKLLNYLHLERLTNIKHDKTLENYIDEILEQYVLKKYPDEKIIIISVNSFLGNSFISKMGRLRIEPLQNINVDDKIAKAWGKLFSEPLTIYEDPNILSYNLKMKMAEFYIMTHEFAHITTNLAFYGQFKPNSLLIHIDGGAYNSNTSVWYFDDKEITCIDYSWKELKNVVNNFNANPLSFYILGEQQTNHLSLPGKLMGYSSYGNPDEKIRKWLLDNNYFLDFTGTANELIDLINQEFSLNLTKFDLKNKLIADIVATIQYDFEENVLEFIKKYKEETRAEYLYYSGGASLNIKCNAKIEDNLGFKQIYIPPPCNDSGLSLGAVYGYLWINKEKIEPVDAYINNIYPNEKSTFSNQEQIKIISDNDLTIISQMLNDGKVIGVYIGDGEAGPRALGHRSIFARPDDIELRIRVSEIIKKREWYRPVAPIVLDYIAKDVFIENSTNSLISKYMLREYHIKDAYINYFKGVIHVDKSVRPQILSKNDDKTGILYKLLNRLYHKYGIMGLINTSFNIRGRPIVQGEKRAIVEGRKMGLDGVFVNGQLYLFK